MTRDERIELIWKCEKEGILGRELQPVSFDYRNVAYWHWPVLKPKLLPKELQEDYENFGEIRW